MSPDPNAPPPVPPVPQPPVPPVPQPPVPPPPPGPPTWRAWHTLLLLLLLVAVGVVGVTLPPRPSFLLTLGLLTAFLTVAGHGVVGLWLGVLIDERNRMSLSRLQTCLWTVVVLAGFLSAALWNVSGWRAPMISVAVPQELWLVMGISLTSLAGTPLVISTKAAPPATPQPAPPPGAPPSPAAAEAAQTTAALAAQGVPPGAVAVRGKVVFLREPGNARPADLFQGDEIGNAAHLDLGKVQMLFFTAALVFAYVVMLAHEFGAAGAAGAGIAQLPALDQGMVALLAISHAGYMANKAAPHSR